MRWRRCLPLMPLLRLALPPTSHLAPAALLPAHGRRRRCRGAGGRGGLRRPARGRRQGWCGGGDWGRRCRRRPLLLLPLPLPPPTCRTTWRRCAPAGTRASALLSWCRWRGGLGRPVCGGEYGSGAAEVWGAPAAAAAVAAAAAAALAASSAAAAAAAGPGSAATAAPAAVAIMAAAAAATSATAGDTAAAAAAAAREGWPGPAPREVGEETCRGGTLCFFLLHRAPARFFRPPSQFPHSDQA